MSDRKYQYPLLSFIWNYGGGGIEGHAIESGVSLVSEMRNNKDSLPYLRDCPVDQLKEFCTITTTKAVTTIHCHMLYGEEADEGATCCTCTPTPKASCLCNATKVNPMSVTATIAQHTDPSNDAPTAVPASTAYQLFAYKSRTSTSVATTVSAAFSP